MRSRRSSWSAFSTWPATASTCWRSRPGPWPWPRSCRRSTRSRPCSLPRSSCASGSRATTPSASPWRRPRSSSSASAPGRLPAHVRACRRLAHSSRSGSSRRRTRPTPPRRAPRSVPSTWPASASAWSRASMSMPGPSRTCRRRWCSSGRRAPRRRSRWSAMTCTCAMGCGSRCGRGRSDSCGEVAGRSVQGRCAAGPVTGRRPASARSGRDRRVLSPGAARPPLATALRLALAPPDGARRHPPPAAPAASTALHRDTLRSLASGADPAAPSS